MALTHVIDTSAIKRLGLPEVRAVVDELASRSQIGRTTICDLEVGYSARSGEEWRRLAEALNVFAAIDTTARHVQRALQVQRLLAEHSQRGRKIPDLLVAAAAEEQDLVILHYDADFDLIASVTGQATQWVVPAGSVS